MTALEGTATTREQATARLVAKKARRRRARLVALAKLKVDAPSRDEGQPTFKGLDRCDECGATLEPESRLWGLCAACEAQLAPRRIP